MLGAGCWVLVVGGCYVDLMRRGVLTGEGNGFVGTGGRRFLDGGGDEDV